MKLLSGIVSFMFMISTAYASQGAQHTTAGRKIASLPALQGLIYDDTGLTIQIANACVTRGEAHPQVEENDPNELMFNFPADKTCDKTRANGISFHFNYSEFGERKGERFTVSNPIKPGVTQDLSK